MEITKVKFKGNLGAVQFIEKQGEADLFHVRLDRDSTVYIFDRSFLKKASTVVPGVQTTLQSAPVIHSPSFLTTIEDADNPPKQVVPDRLAEEMEQVEAP